VDEHLLHDVLRGAPIVQHALGRGERRGTVVAVHPREDMRVV
jgi:hypothetical protein